MTEASELIRLARQVGVLTVEDITSCMDEFGSNHPDPEDLVKTLTKRGLITPLHISKLNKGDLSGYFHGGNKILYKIASGGFARVFRGINIQTGESVAIKVLRKRWTSDPSSIQAFEHEGKVGQLLRHPNIVRIDDIGQSVDEATQEPVYWMVMEFVEGGNLKDLLKIRRGKIADREEVIRLMLDIMNGMDFAFQKGITHRDIKLTNILAAADAKLKLVDFGLATVHKSEVLAEEAHGQRTVEYAQLEKTTGAPKGDPRSDIFFLGAVFYQMLSGHPPFPERRDRTQRMLRTRVDGFKHINEVDTSVPPDLVNIVDRMMEMNPGRRYQTPAEAIRDLSKLSDEVALKPLEEEAASADIRRPPSVLLVERDSTLQDRMREKLQSLGYRVLITNDPERGISMYERNSVGCVVVDCETVGREGLTVFDEMQRKARVKKQKWAGILLLGEDQSEWADENGGEGSIILVKPSSIRDLRKGVQKLLPYEQEVE